MKRLTVFILVFMVMFSCAGCSLANMDRESLKFKEVAGGYALYRYKGSSQRSNFTVPDEYNGKKVVEILDFAIANSEYIKTLNLGKNIEKIDEWGIVNCSSLQEIIVNAENKNFKAADGILYNKNMTELITYPNGKTALQKDDNDNITGGGIVTVPQSVKIIRNNAFYLCGNLWKITFNEGLTEIGNKAFLKCGNLQNFTLPGTLQKIGVDSFSYCDSLTKVTIPKSVTSIGDFAFFSLSSIISEITIQRENADGLTLGKDWIPNKKDTVKQKVKVVYIPG